MSLLVTGVVEFLSQQESTHKHTKGYKKSWKYDREWFLLFLHWCVLQVFWGGYNVDGAQFEHMIIKEWEPDSLLRVLGKWHDVYKESTQQNPNKYAQSLWEII